MRPAPANSTTASDISVTTSTAERYLPRLPPLDPRLPSLSEEFTSSFDSRRAGTSPNRIPVPSEAAVIHAEGHPGGYLVPHRRVEDAQAPEGNQPAERAARDR